MKKKFRIVLVVLGSFLVFPLLLTAFLSGKETLLIRKQWNMEAFLPMLMCREIPWEYEEEMKKVQAVLTRSSLYLRLEEKEENGEEWKKLWDESKAMEHKKGYPQAYRSMEAAVRETEGEVLVWQNKVCEGVFHRISGGATRDGMEIFGKIEKGYLVSVDSNWDMYGDGYLSGHYFSGDALKIQLENGCPGVNFSDDPLKDQIIIEKRDAAGYVLELMVGGTPVTGEAFRKILELPSADFTMQEADGKIRFLCKGQGHGLGLSQYGGNMLAKEGKSYKEILRYYFPECEIKTR